MITNSTIRTVFRWIAALFFVGVGAQHFTSPDTFLHIMPPYLPYPLELVYLSGFFEIAGGIGLLVPRTRRFAGWGLIALLIAVYPANIHMLVNDIYLPDMPSSRILLWLRMPMQLVFAFIVLWTAGIWPRTNELHTSVRKINA